MKLEVGSLKGEVGKKRVRGLGMKSDLPERSFIFAREIILFCKDMQAEHKGVMKNLISQLFRSGTSVGANVAEGQGAQSRADFISKYSIACKEARETFYWLGLLDETEEIKHPKLDSLKTEANELVAILTTIILKLKENK